MSRPGEQQHDEQTGEVLPFPERRTAPVERPADAPNRPGGGDNTGQAAVLEGELVDERPATPVDPPPGTSGQPWVRTPTPRPVLAPWLRDTEQRRQAQRWALRYVAHAAAFHAVRAPVYAAQAAVYAPRGGARVFWRVTRWVTYAEQHPLRQHAVRNEDSWEHLKLMKNRDEHVKPRRIALAAVLVPALVGALLVERYGPGWAQALALTALVLVLAYHGRPTDRPWISPAVLAPQVQRLTAEIVTTALGSLGLAGIDKALRDGRGVTFPAPITRDGPGWRADVDLPHGVTAVDIVERRGRLASGLRRPLGCVWPEPAGDEHAGRLVLWVGDQDVKRARQPEWPLRKTGSVDLFRPAPFGTDQRGRWVPVTLMFTSVAVGAVPRMGKTFTLRQLLLLAALDPRAQVHAYDNKGTGDLGPLEPVCHRYGVGDEPDEIEAALTDLRELRTELRRRTKVIRTLPRDICPENKVTPELAGKPHLGLAPIVVGVDECQVWFEHPDHGREFEEIATDLVKRGPAVGIVLIVATQKPDAKALPTGISANVTTRFCLKVMDQTSNDQVLGTSRYKQGTRATLFGWEDKGIGYLVSEGTDARIVRTVNLDGPAAEQVVRRARLSREQLGTISGHAAGEQPDRQPPVIPHVLAALEGDEQAHSAVLCARLSERHPQLYAGWEPTLLAAALKPHGVTTRQVWATGLDGERTNRNGVVRTELEAAARKALEGLDRRSEQD